MKISALHNHILFHLNWCWIFLSCWILLKQVTINIIKLKSYTYNLYMEMQSILRPVRRRRKRRGRLIHLFKRMHPCWFCWNIQVVTDDSKYYAQIMYVEVFALCLSHLNETPQAKTNNFLKESRRLYFYINVLHTHTPGRRHM